MLRLLGIPFDTNMAHEIMTEEPGSATRLMYQLFIALENKKKANLTGVAMETMRPAAPAKLQGMESLLYKEVRELNIVLLILGLPIKMGSYRNRFLPSKPKVLLKGKSLSL